MIDLAVIMRSKWPMHIQHRPLFFPFYPRNEQNLKQKGILSIFNMGYFCVDSWHLIPVEAISVPDLEQHVHIAFISGRKALVGKWKAPQGCVHTVFLFCFFGRKSTDFIRVLHKRNTVWWFCFYSNKSLKMWPVFTIRKKRQWRHRCLSEKFGRAKANGGALWL